MNLSDENISNLFKQKLENFESEPEIDSWSKIALSIPQKPKVEATENYNLNLNIFNVLTSLSMLLLVGVFSFVINDSEIDNKRLNNKLLDKKLVFVSKSDSIKKSDKLVIANTTINYSKHEIEKIASDKILEILLSDGSKVVLNKNAKLKYSKDFDQNRTVYLEGEAYFEITKHKLHNFSIVTTEGFYETNDSKIYINTKYDSLIQDFVFIESGTTKLINSLESIQLNNNKVFVISDKGTNIAEEELVTNYKSWVDNKLVFNNTLFKNVVYDLEKFYNVKLKVTNSNLYNCRFTGTFEKATFDETMEVLAHTFNFSQNFVDGSYVISGNGCK